MATGFAQPGPEATTTETTTSPCTLWVKNYYLTGMHGSQSKQEASTRHACR